ncbi:MAG: AI-2E family transporter [Acidimicrobiia bacterium]
MSTPAEEAESPKFRRRVLTVALIVLAIAAALWLAYQIRGLLVMVFVALAVAVAMEPPVHALEKRGWRRGLATGMVFLAAIALVVLFIWTLAPLFIRQIGQLVRALPGYVESVLAFLESTFGLDIGRAQIESIGDDLARYLSTAGGSLVGGIVGFTAGVFGMFIFVATVALFSFYMVADLPKLQRTVLSILNPESQRRALHIWDLAVEKMGLYIYSRLILAALSAVLATTFLGFLDVPFALSLGIWVGVLSQFIPVIGTYLAAVVPAVVALSSRGVGTMLWVIVFFVVYQQIENYLISPRITQRTMEIHPAVSVAAILIGASLMGGIGVVLALPMAGIIQAIVSEWGQRHAVVLDGDDSTPIAGNG